MALTKTLYFDLETTGTDPVKNGIIQIAGIIDINGKITDQFNYKVRPFDVDEIEDKALEVNQTTREKIKLYDPAPAVFVKLIDTFAKAIDRYNKFDKFYAAGFNANFDISFLREFFNKNGDQYFGSWFNGVPVDGYYIAKWLQWRGLIAPENLKLETLCKLFNIEISAHDALSDIAATRELILKFNDLMKYVDRNKILIDLTSAPADVLQSQLTLAINQRNQREFLNGKKY